MGNRKHRQIGSRAAFDAMMGPSSFEEMMWAAKPDDPHAFEGRMSLHVGISAHPAPIPESEYFDHHDLRLIRGVLIGKVLAARDLRACERAGALLDEWLAVFPEDSEMRTYGAFVLRMRSALNCAAREAGAGHDLEL